MIEIFGARVKKHIKKPFRHLNLVLFFLRIDEIGRYVEVVSRYVSNPWKGQHDHLIFLQSFLSIYLFRELVLQMCSDPLLKPNFSFGNYLA